MGKSTKNKYKTGFCQAKQCEGTKPKNWRGVPMPTCKAWDTCPCECHALIDTMFEAAGVERVLQENPEYKPDYGDFVMPDRGAVRAATPSSMPGGTDALPQATEPSAANVAPMVARSPQRTATGRKAKGTLEMEVLQVCREYSKGVWDWSACIPKVIAERIGKMNAAEPPSVGAIGAIFDRWEKLGFAEQAKKPVRFVRFVNNDGSDEALERAKYEAKASHKRARTIQRRGF